MNWRGPIKDIQVELPADLHRAVRTKAIAEDMKIYQAYAMALEWYLGHEPVVPEVPDVLRDLTSSQERFLCGLSDMLRDPAISKTRRGIVNLLKQEVDDYLQEHGVTADLSGD